MFTTSPLATRPATRLSLDRIASALSDRIGYDVRVHRERYDLGLVITGFEGRTFWMEMTFQYWQDVERPTSIEGWVKALTLDWFHDEWAELEQ